MFWIGEAPIDIRASRALHRYAGSMGTEASGRTLSVVSDFFLVHFKASAAFPRFLLLFGHGNLACIVQGDWSYCIS